MTTIHHSLDALLAEGNLSFFGYTEQTLPDIATKVRSGRTRAYVREGRRPPLATSKTSVARYERLSDIRDEHSDVYFLDHEAVKVLFAEFPVSAQFVLIRLVPRVSWLFALPGLIRRLHIGLLVVEGVRTFTRGGFTEHWLVLRHRRRNVLHTRLSLSEEIGISGLLEHLRSKQHTYVVLRFFSSLPNLHRAQGDLDLLVADEDEGAVKEFIKAHPGSLGVDVWTVSKISHNSITYYPPPLAREILASRIEGLAGSFIPAPKEAFLSFAYHIVYHKGLFSGVPTTLPGLTTNPHPENDYTGEALRLSGNAGIDIPITLESLDEYLGSVGWRPQLDTLAKIAPRNKWVWARFFAAPPQKETGLAVIILKQKARDDGKIEDMLSRIRAYPGFVVLRTKTLSEEEQKRAARELRGGVWDTDSSRKDFLPAVVVLVVDTELARAALLAGMTEQRDRGIRHLKKLLRKEFDLPKGSLTHATDFTHEAWEYVSVCFPGEKDAILQEVEGAVAKLSVPLYEQIRYIAALVPRYFAYKLARFLKWYRGALVRFVMEK